MNTLQTVALAATVALVPLAASTSGAAAADKKAVLTTYADIAHAAYQDSLTTAEALRQAVEKLLADPSEDTLAAARAAWTDARVPSQPSEAYPFATPTAHPRVGTGKKESRPG